MSIKNKMISCRFTEEEFKKIREYLKKNNLKVYDIFYYFLKKYSKDFELKKIYELKKIGNNLNQIAKKINEFNNQNLTEEFEKFNIEFFNCIHT